MNSISMNTSSNALIVTCGKSKEIIRNNGGAVVMGGITYELKDSKLTMTSASSESLKQVKAFFSYNNVKYKFGDDEGVLKSSDMSKRIKDNTCVHKNIFRKLSGKWKYDNNQSQKSVLDKLKNPGIKENQLGSYKTMKEIYDNHENALDFFTKKYEQEKNDDYRDDYRKIVKGINELSSRLVEMKEQKINQN